MATENLRYNIILNDQVSAGLAKIEARLSSLEAGFNRSNKSADSMNGFMKGSFMLNAAGMIANIANQAWGMAEAYVQSAGSLQANTNALKVASGSSAEFAKNQVFLEDLTNKLPISIIAASEGLKMWTAATKTSTIAGGTARQIFEDVSVATASMGIDAETSKGIFLALSQMMSKGKVSAEELRGQLGERLPGAFAIMAQSMGVSEARLGKMMEQGEVISSQVLPKFASVLRDQFGGGLAEANNSINAVTTRLENMKTRGIIAMTPTIQTLLLKFEQFANYIAGLNFEPFLDVIRPYIAAVSQLGDMFQKLFGGVESGNTILKVMATLMQTAMMPFQLLTGMVLSLGEAFNTLYEAISLASSGEFSKAGERIAKGFEQIGKIRQDTQNRAFGTFGDIWKDTPDKGKMINEATAGIDFSFMEGKNKSVANTGVSGKSKELEKASANISGSAPRNITIDIKSLIGQNNNYISNVSDPSKDLATFMDKLKQALQQEIIDASIQGL